jgi:RNA polymerase sigma-70 factor (ECF subfamily)
LTELERSAIRLAYFGGLTCVQVAAHLGVPEPTARTWIRDGLRRIAAELAPRVRGNDGSWTPYVVPPADEPRTARAV